MSTLRPRPIAAVIVFLALVALFIAPIATPPERAQQMEPTDWSAFTPIQKQMIENLRARTERGRLAVCFAEGTPESVLSTFALEASGPHGISAFQFEDGDRWTSTATDGGGLSRGEPTTLTWGFIPDGTNINGFAGESTSDSDLIEMLDDIYGDGPGGSDLTLRPWFDLFESVFDEWGELIGVNYVYEAADDGASQGFFAGSLGVRADIRIGGHYIDGTSGVLAYNFFPNTSDMVIDTADGVFNNTSGNSLRLRNVISHEHGHGLGINHVCPVNGTWLMEPFLATGFDGPQADDILAANRGYGDRYEFPTENDTYANGTNLGSIDGGDTVSLTTLSVDGLSDEDFYRFTAAAGSTATITVTPTGSTYLSGPQNANGTCSAGTSFNSLRQSDLAVQLIDTNGSTVITTRDAGGLGVAEVITSAALTTGGVYAVRIFGDADAAQLYDLDVAVAGGTAPLSRHINAAGGNFTDSNGTLFVADKTYTSGDFGFIGGQAVVFSNSVSGTTDDALYSSFRAALTSFQCDFDVPNGTYDVTLYFTEYWHNSAGKRVFDVAMEGDVKVDDLDIYVESGGKFAAHSESASVTVSDGRLDIDFIGSVGYPTVSAVSLVASSTPPTPTPNVAATPTSLAYGSVSTGQTSDKVFQLSNTGTANLSVTALASTNSLFTIVSPTSFPITITPSGTPVDVTVRFAPTATGAQSGDVQVTSNDPDGVLTVGVSGTGVAPNVTAAPTSLAFGDVTTGQTSDLVVQLSNTGTANLSVTALGSTNGVFTIVSPTSFPFTITPGGTAVPVTVRFSPTTTGAQSGDIQVTSNDPDGVLSVSASGTGVAAQAVSFAINAAGGNFTDSNGTLFVADKLYTSGDFGFIGGQTVVFTNSVRGTTDDALYASVRAALTSFQCDFDVPNGTYDVTLYFTEFWWKAAGARVFDVVMEGDLKVDDLDIYAETGRKFTAHTETATVTVTDGRLDIDFVGVVGFPTVSAVSIVKR